MYRIIHFPKTNQAKERINDGFFKKETIDTHQIWEVADTPYYIFSNTSHIDSFFKTSLPRRLDNDTFKNIVAHFIEKEMVLDVHFTYHDEHTWEELGITALSTLSWDVRKNQLSQEKKERALEELELCINEGYDLDCIELKVNSTRLSSRLYSTCSLSFTPGQLTEEEALCILVEASTIADQHPATLNKVSLQEECKVPHPLRAEHNVLKRLFSLSGDQVQKELQLSEEDFLTIKSHVLQESAPFQEQSVYKSEAERLHQRINNTPSTQL